jgi:hypothetical protein
MIGITPKNTDPTEKNTQANFDSELIATYNHNTEAFAHIIEFIVQLVHSLINDNSDLSFSLVLHHCFYIIILYHFYI